MNRQTILLLLVCFAFGCTPPADSSLDLKSGQKLALPKSSATQASVADLLPVGKTGTMLLEYQLPLEINDLAEKMAASISSHANWIQGYIKSQSHVPQGVALPYHENFGITEQEYDLLNKTLEQIALTPSVPCTLNVENENDGLFQISVHGEDFLMSGLTINAKKMSASFGDITAYDPVESESPSDAPYRVDGIRWKTELSNPTPERIQTLFVRIGKNLSNGNGILMYRVLHVENGRVLAQGELNIEWPADSN